jgi:TPR repeat protein
VEAAYQLGRLYACGHGVLASLADAAAYYRRAAEGGHAEAQHQLSLLHLNPHQSRRSSFVQWYGAAAEQDHETAERNRQLLFPNGVELPQDTDEALNWSRAAAAQGIADAQANIGLIYTRGVGREPNYEEARRWYERAAEQGSAAAELGLGILHANGHGVEIDLPAAASWYQKAAEKGNGAAQLALGLMYLSGQGVARDTENGRRVVQQIGRSREPASAVQSGTAHSGGWRPAQ